MPNDAIEILLAEDNTADVYLVKEAIRAHDLVLNVNVVRDGEAAIRFIEAAEQDENSPCPQLALVDLNLPRMSGLEVLARLRLSAKFGAIPVAMMSSSRSSSDARMIAQLRADYFFTKPSDYDEFMALGGIIKSLLERVHQELR